MSYRNIFTIKNLIIAAFAVVTSGCAITPVPVRLIKLDPLPEISSNNVEKKQKTKVALVSNDQRSSVFKNSNVFGLKRNGMQIPMGLVFLAHAENFDKVVLRSAKPMLENAGFDVITTIPDITGKVEDDESVSSGDASFSQLRSEYGQFEDEAKEGDTDEAANSRDINQKTIVQAIDPAKFGDADAVVEIRTHSFFTDMNPAISWLHPVMHSWMIADVYVYPVGTGSVPLLFGRKIKSYTWNAYFSLTNGEVEYNMVANRSYDNVMSEVEGNFRSTPFREALERVLLSDKVATK